MLTCPDQCNCAYDKCMAGHLDSQPLRRVPMNDKDVARISALEAQVDHLIEIVKELLNGTKAQQDPNKA